MDVAQKGHINALLNDLESARSTENEQEARIEDLEYVCPLFEILRGQFVTRQVNEKLRRDLEGKAREKEEVLVQLEAQQPVGARGTDFVHP